MTTNPPGNDSGTPIHDRTAASEGHEVYPGVTVPSFGSDTSAPRDTDREFDDVLLPEGDVRRPEGFDDVEPLDALPADEQLPATPSAAGASAPLHDSTTTSTGYLPPVGTSTGTGSTGTGSTGSTGSGGTDGGGKADAAKGAAQDVAGDAKDKAASVAGTAKEQASNVASEATDHAKQLYSQASDTLKEQAAGQQERAAGGLRSLGEQLGRMADNDDEQGIAAKVVRDLSNRAGSAAGYLENRDPGSLLDEVKSFAAKRPGTFIALAAGAGILAGRLTKALATEVKHEKEAGESSTGTGSGV
jgi:cell division septum initiation protein DivIVA